MKPVLPALLAGLALLSSSQAGDRLWDPFDSYPAGSIADQPGWAAAPWLSTRTAQVSSVQYSSPSNSLELPWHADGSSAAFTNFVSTFSPGVEHPVIRWSARVFVENPDIVFELGLRNSAAGAFLHLRNEGGYASLGFTHLGALVFPFPSGRFVDVTAWYNRSNNLYRLDLDQTNVISWSLSDSDPTIHTQFNQFGLTRLTNTASTTGGLFIDDVAVETFLPDTRAWWRCTALTNARVSEQLGVFTPSSRYSYSSVGVPGVSDPVWDGTNDVRNEGATTRLVADPATCVAPPPAATNWTVEAVFRLAPGSGNTSFLDWGKGLGFDTNGTWLGFGYIASYGTFYLNARDADQPDDSSVFISFGPFVPDGRWHHAAVVKSNITASLYLDYQYVTNRPLPAEADGSYAFGTDSHATVGVTLNGGNECNNDSAIDEIRFSGTALEVSEFLQPGQPILVRSRNSATNADWNLLLQCLPGKTYRLETGSGLAPAAWQAVTGSTFAATGIWNSVEVPTLAPTNFIRAVRED